MKRVMALLLAAVLLSLLAGCAREVLQTTTETPTTQPATETTVPRPTPGYVTEPVTIEFWHHLMGDEEALLNRQVARFNETNEFGITVVATGMGSMGDIYSRLTEAMNKQRNVPDLVVSSGWPIEELNEAGYLADMGDYAWRDGWDLENFPASLRSYMQHYEGEAVCFPYNVSTYVLYYNKAYYPEPPESLEQWVEMARRITEENPKVHGMYLPISFTTLQRPILESLGASGVVNEAGDGPGENLFDAMQTFCTDWLSWMEEGFCSPFPPTQMTI